jgi:glyoxylase-like metal-dependent hydrolase (beta-lactamase superfamily II)
VEKIQGVLETEEGLLIVDSQYTETAEDLLKRYIYLTSKSVKYLINTHLWMK